MRSFSTDSVTQFVTERREFFDANELSRMKAVVPPGKNVPARWQTTLDVPVLVIGEGESPEHPHFLHRDRIFAGTVEIRKFTEVKDRERMHKVIPSCTRGYVAVARSTLIKHVQPDGKELPESLLVEIGLIPSQNDPPIASASTGDDLDGKSEAQLVTIAIREGLRGTNPNQAHGALVQAIRAHRKAKKEKSPTPVTPVKEPVHA